MDFGGWTFGIGTTVALFHRLGTIPVLMEALKIWHTSSVITKAKSLKNQEQFIQLVGTMH
jgi:hypothetical protein